MIPTLKQLKEGHIVGIIKHNGFIDSVYVESGDSLYHSTYWKTDGITMGRWHWNYHHSFDESNLGSNISREEYRMIREHLTKRYDISWQENGYHDWRKMQEEEVNK